MRLGLPVELCRDAKDVAQVWTPSLILLAYREARGRRLSQSFVGRREGHGSSPVYAGSQARLSSFTVLELLVAVSMIAPVAALVLPAMDRALIWRFIEHD